VEGLEFRNIAAFRNQSATKMPGVENRGLISHILTTPCKI